MTPKTLDKTQRETARRLASIELVDADGSPVTVGSAWAEKPSLLVFIRHFG